MTTSRRRSRPASRTAVLVSLCLLWAPDLQSSESKPPEIPRTVAPDAFCPALARALCEGPRGCTCAPEQIRCAIDVLSRCSAPDGLLGSRARAALDDGLVIYDGARAHAVVNRLTRTGGCDAPLDALNWTHEAMLRFGGILRGTVVNGAPCRIPFRVGGVNTCATGVCRSREDEVPRCVPLRSLGEPCGPDVACIDRHARATREPPSGAGFGAFCGEDGRCRGPAGNGADCREPRECTSGRCADGACRPALETSAPCEASEDCASGLCADVAGSAEAVCRPRKRGIEEACSRPEQCMSHACLRGRCSEPMCPS